MNIIDALTEHNTIAREVWPAGEYVAVVTNELRRVRINTLAADYSPTLADLLADDWQPVT